MSSEILQIILLLVAPVLTLFGFLIRRAFMKLETTMTEEEIRSLMADKLDILELRLEYLARDMERNMKSITKSMDSLTEEMRYERQEHQNRKP